MESILDYKTIVDSFILSANVADYELYKQAGNSITVSIIEAIAKKKYLLS